MTVRIAPHKAAGKIIAPPSKSMAHRLLICAALSERSEISGVDFSEDIKATLSCLFRLGAEVDISENRVVIGGLDPFAPPRRSLLDCGESGSTLRFLLPLSLLSGAPVSFSGHGRLMQRPLGIYEEICKEQGLPFSRENGCVTVCGPLKAGKFEINGSVSSQFISGMLFALPRLPAESVISVSGNMESASYIGLTLKSLAEFGVRASRLDGRTFRIPGGQTFRSREMRVEGDCSNAAFAESLNLFGGSVAVEGLDENTLQGDRVYRGLFRALCRPEPPVIDLSDCPDLAPIMFAVAAAKNGGKFVGTARLKMKESDRAEAMREELAKLGVPVEIGENSVTVAGGMLRRPSAPLSGHNDHRIVMSLAVLCSLTGGIITGAQAVSKSYPHFFEDMRKLGIPIEEAD